MQSWKTRERNSVASVFPTGIPPIGIFPISSPTVNYMMGVNTVDKMTAVEMAEHILKEYRTLDCSCCNKFFGYMHRQTGAIFCSSHCLSSDSNGPGHAVPFGHAILPAPTPLTAQQVVAVTNHVGHSETNGLVQPPQQQVPKKDTSRDFVDSGRTRTPVLKEKNPFSKETDTPSNNKPVSDVKGGIREVDGTGGSSANRQPSEVASEEKNPFAKNTPLRAGHSETNGLVQPRQQQVPKKDTSRDFVDSGSRAPILKEKNPFSKETELVQPPQQQVPKKDTSRDFVDSGRTRTPVLKEKNPFSKETDTPSNNKPVSDVKGGIREVDGMGKSSANRQPSEVASKEKNPFVKNTPLPAEKVKSIKEIVISPNPVALKLRSELPFPSEPDEFMGLVLMGGKCNDNGPVDFYFQTTAMALKLESLQRDINNFSATAMAAPLKNLELGQLVFAPFQDELFRGEVIGIPRADVAEVFFVDYGNSVEIPRKDLAALPKEFFDVPRLCFQCQWDFWLAKDPGEELSEKDTARYHSTEKIGIAPVLKIGDGQYVVAIGPKAENVKFTVPAFFKPEKVPMKSIVARPTPPFKPAAVQRKKYMFKDSEYSPLLIDGKNVKIGYAWDSNKYLIVAPEDEDLIMKLQVIVNESLSPARLLKTLPDVDEIVLAPYMNEFYRAKVVAHEGKEIVKVMFFDFGDMASVQFIELYEPTEEIMKHPIYAMNILLNGVSDAKGLALDHEANELVGNLMQLQIHKRPEGDSDVFSVTLWKGDETLNRVIKRLAANAKEQELRKAEQSILSSKSESRIHEGYLDRLCMRNSFTRSLLENYEKVQTALVYEKTITDNVPFTYKWSEYDTQFKYFENEVSLQPLQGIVEFEIVRYKKLDSIVVSPHAECYESIRESVSEEIGAYLRGLSWDSCQFKPELEQVCLVKLPFGKERSEIYTKVDKGGWFSKSKHTLDKTDNNHSGKWHRGVCKDISKTPDFYGIEFIDLGKACYVPKTYIYKCPLRFVIAPILRTTLVILWQEMVQLTTRLNYAMELVLKPGKILKTLIIAEHEDITLVHLLEPEEDALIKEALVCFEKAQASCARRLVLRKPTRRTKLYRESLLEPKWLRINKNDEPCPGLVPERYVVNLASSSDDELEDRKTKI